MFGRNKFSLLAGLAAALGTPFGRGSPIPVLGTSGLPLPPSPRPGERHYSGYTQRAHYSPERPSRSQKIIRAATKLGYGRRSVLGRALLNRPVRGE